MTGTSRSSRSTSTSTPRSPRPPTWRTTLTNANRSTVIGNKTPTSKTNTPPKLSYVFAEPKMVNTNANASDILAPNANMNNAENGASPDKASVNVEGVITSGSDLTAEGQAEGFIEAGDQSSDRCHSSASLDGGRQVSIPLSSTEAGTMSGLPNLTHEPTSTLDVSISASTSAAAAPSSPHLRLPPSPIDMTASTPRKSSWFGSLSRARGKTKVDQMRPTGSRSSANISGPGTDIGTRDDPPAQLHDPLSSLPPQEIRTPTISISDVSPVPPEPQPEPQSSRLPNTPPSKRSWFLSVASPAPQFTPSLQPHPPRGDTELVHSAPTTPESQPHEEISRVALDTPSPSTVITQQPVMPQKRRSWLSTPSLPLPTTKSSTSPILPTHSIPSSLDEEVSSLTGSTTPVPFPSSSPGTEALSPSVPLTPSPSGEPGRPRLSSLNPSTSRFMLSIPLLGRAKVPLERAVVQADVHENSQTTEPAIDPPKTDTMLASAETTEEPTRASTSAKESESATSPQASLADTDLAPPAASNIVASTSWWAYITWSGNVEYRADIENHVGSEAVVGPVDDDQKLTTTVQPSSQPSTVGTLTTDEEHRTRATKGNYPTLSETADLLVSSRSANLENTSIPGPQMPTHNGASTSDQNLSSSRSSAEASATDATPPQGIQTQPSWYYPWSWYGHTTSTEADPMGASNSSGSIVGADLEIVDGESDRGSMGNRETGMVQETMQLRDEGLPDSGTSVAPPDEQRQRQHRNPLEQSFETQKEGWASFFTSRALGMKRIAAPGNVKRDENGMEVMEIDFEGEEDAGMGEKVEGEGEGSRGRSGKPGVIKNKGDSTAATERISLAPPLIVSETVKNDVEKANPAVMGKTKPKSIPTSKTSPPTSAPGSVTKAPVIKKSSSPAPSRYSARSASGASTPIPRTPAPNLVLPTWMDTFHTAPRNVVPPPPETTFGKTLRFVSGVLLGTGDAKQDKSSGGVVGKEKAAETKKGKERAEEFLHFGKELPRAWDVTEGTRNPKTGKENLLNEDVLRGCKRVVVIGIHGWFPGAVMRTVLGEPTGTSGKFVSMMVQALEEFQERHSVRLEKITKIPLEGEGTINGRVQKLYMNLRANQEWMGDLHDADAIILATHSQGSVVSTHLLDRLIQDGHIRTSRNMSASTSGAAAEPLTAPQVDMFSAAGFNSPQTPGTRANYSDRPPQRVCCLALCGIHLGPLRYLSSSSLLLPYIQYFESTAAKELFEFQNTENEVSKQYVNALRRVLDNGTKMVYVASLNDQVVPIYSGLFTAVSHPLILRALYIDGDAYHSSDFLSNLLVLLLRILNSGIPDSGLLAHLSEATAGSLNGVGHSTAYEEISTYSLAVDYLFLANDGLADHPELVLEHFNASNEQNDYEIPWSLRDIIADERVSHFFSSEITELRDAFREWHPKTTILRDLKRKLQPIQRLPASLSYTSRLTPSSSKL